MNDEKRQKNLEADITIYKSLIVAAGILAVILLMGIADSRGANMVGKAILFAPIAILIFFVILLVQVIDFLKCSWIGRRRLLLWYTCLFVLVMEASQSDFIFAIAPVVLLVLPVIWLWKAFRS